MEWNFKFSDYTHLLSAFIIATKYFYSDKIKEDEFGEACNAYGREGKLVERFGRKIWRKDNNWRL